MIGKGAKMEDIEKMNDELNEIKENIIDLVYEMSVENICKEIHLGDLRNFVQTWRQKIIREAEKIENVEGE